MAENNQVFADNIKFGMKEIIQLVVFVVGIGITYGTMNNRLQSLEAKVEVLEGDRELLVRLDERLKSFDEKLDAISIAVGKQQSSN